MAHPLIGIVGPTASGKSELAMRVARAWPAEIVSCDSLQVYKKLDIGSAKPSLADRREIPHHLIDVVDPDESFSAADYAHLARRALREITARRRLPILVGGAGLYLRALFEGLFPGPSRHEGLRSRLAALADTYGEGRLHRLLAHIDPDSAARIAARDRVRIVRAIEVYWLTGRPISAWQNDRHDTLEGFNIHLVGLNPPRAALRLRVERRSQAMLDAGLIAEVRALLETGFTDELRPLQAIGYRETVAFVGNRLDQSRLLECIVVSTMRYAKRQMTWFRNQLNVEWHSETDEAYAAVSSWLGRTKEKAAGTV